MSERVASVRQLEALLSSLGVTQYDPVIVPQLLEFMHRKLAPAFPQPLVSSISLPSGHAADVFTEAQILATHRTSRPDEAINKEDVRLAIQSSSDLQLAPPPPREVCVCLSIFPDK